MEANGEPARYPRRVLLAIAGLTPQVVTETIYALAEDGANRFVPTEVHLITTAEGAERARLTLLGDDPGWFYALCREYELEDIAFTEDNIHVLRDDSGRPLGDIRRPDDNECAANLITEWIRRFTLDDDSALHVSLAGGRKTMGFYAGYALSLFGRAQDRLSHVLVSPPELESHPLFFYPSRSRRVVYSQDATQRPLDTLQASVTLGYLPFVKLRHGLPDSLREGATTFTDAVDAVTRSLGPPHLVLDPAASRIIAKGQAIRLPRAGFVFYYWLTQRLLRGEPLVKCPPEGVPDSELGCEFLAVYEELYGEMGVRDTTREALETEGGMTKDYFNTTKSRVNSVIARALDGRLNADPYRLVGFGGRPETRFGPNVLPEQIEIV